MKKIKDKSFQIYLSYLPKDRIQAEKILDALQKIGVDVWTNEKNILPGQHREEEIYAAIQKSDIVLVCLSKNFIENEGYAQKELKIALEITKEKPEGMIYLIPVRLEDCDIPQSLRMFEKADVFKSGKYSKLIKSIEEKANKISKEIKGKRNEAYLVYRCNYCKKSINPTKNEGHIYVIHEELSETKRQYQNIKASGRKSIRADEIPDLAEWKTAHYNCSQQDDAWYSIEIYRIRTFQQVIEWTSHLMIKNWIGHTNWFEIISHIAKNAKTKIYQ
jgi:hypothetical protein